MIGKKYETHTLGGRVRTFDTMKEARSLIEIEGRGFVLAIVGERNLPHALPNPVWRTAAGWELDKGVWYAMELHGSGTGRWPEEPIDRDEVSA